MIKIFILSLFFVLSSFVSIYAANNDESINWHDSLEEALGEAKFVDIPIMINISTDFKNLDKNIFSKDKFIDKAKDFVSLNLNYNNDENAKLITKRYGITNQQYTIYIDPNTLEVLSRLKSNNFSQSAFYDSMQKAIDTKSILEDIKNTDKPTVEGMEFYINQNDADKAYKILLDATKNNNKIYSISKGFTSYTLSEKSKAEYFNQIADIYFYQYKNYKNTIYTYLSLIKHCPSETEQVFNADSRIIEIYRSQNNTDGLINHINQILSRANTPIKYKERYLDIVLEIEEDDF